MRERNKTDRMYYKKKGNEVKSMSVKNDRKRKKREWMRGSIVEREPIK